MIKSSKMKAVVEFVSRREKEPLIYAAFGALIGADQRNDGQRKSAVPFPAHEAS